MNLENHFFRSEYNDSSRILRINNRSSEDVHIDLSLICLDTELCFYNGWAAMPAWGYADIDLSQTYSDGIHQLGIGVIIFSKETGESIYRRDHMVKDGKPLNLISSDLKELQYGSWYTLIFQNECEGIFNFSEDDVI